MKDLGGKIEIYEKEINNLKVVFIKRAGVFVKFGLLTVKFGSMISNVRVGNRSFVIPDGTAHFLEHKLFEINGKDAAELFSKFGADANAFTGRSSMSFYFTTSTKFFDCLFTLFDLVFTKREFSKRAVEREKLIIENEILMYEDNPYYLGYKELINSMFWFNPIKKEVAGTVNSIKEVNPQVLSFAHNTFITPKNSTLFILGDIYEDELFEKLFKEINSLEMNKDPETYSDLSLIYEEPFYPRIRKVEKEIRISKDLLFIGFKPKKSKFSIEEIITSNLILDIIFGPTSEFYDSIYSKMLIDDSFNYTFDWERDYGFPIISGFTSRLNELTDALQEEIKRRLHNGITDYELEISKNNAIGEIYMLVDNPTSLIEEISTIYLSGVSSLGQYLAILNSINLTKANELITKIFSLDNSVITTIHPAK